MTDFVLTQSGTFVADHDRCRLSPIPVIDVFFPCRRGSDDRDALLLQFCHNAFQIGAADVRKPEHAAGACPDDFSIVEACRTSQCNASSRAKRFGDTENRSNIARILKAAEDDQQRRAAFKNLFKAVLSGPDGGDHALRMLRVLDRFEDVSRNFMARLSLDTVEVRAHPCEKIDDSYAVAARFFDQD